MIGWSKIARCALYRLSEVPRPKVSVYQRVSNQCNLNTYVIVPCWSEGALASVLKCVASAAFRAEFHNSEFSTVVPSAPGCAFVTFPYVSTHIVTTTVPDTLTLYSGFAIIPTTLRPFKVIPFDEEEASIIGDKLFLHSNSYPEYTIKDVLPFS